jgi:hypothetical protein
VLRRMPGFIAEFMQALSALGWMVDRNMRLDIRWTRKCVGISRALGASNRGEGNTEG